jgi:alkylation response protein AidB-like acyl-CoA dehydrogenase
MSEAKASTEIEDVESFRARAREFIRANMPEAEGGSGVLRNIGSKEEELELVQYDRRLQRTLYDGGFAGIAVPTEYGGQGLTAAHQRAFNEEMRGFRHPWRFQSPTFSPILPVILDFGTEEQKKRHIPPMLKGERFWMQFLSEPSGGSDVAGALTSAVRDGDEWILNGSKIWTTGAWWSDWALCLARTNWDVEKHRGLTVFMLPLESDGIEVRRIEMLNGNKEFCEEFLTDVRVPDADRLGEVDDGWTVGSRWMIHERSLYNSPYVTVPGGLRGEGPGSGSTAAVKVARAAGVADDPHFRDLIGEMETIQLASGALDRRIAEGARSGTASPQASSVGRLLHGYAGVRSSSILFELAGAAGPIWLDDEGELAQRGNDYLLRQVSCLGGGTTEIARNVISERVLGMPREVTKDKGVAFRDVPRGAKS